MVQKVTSNAPQSCLASQSSLFSDDLIADTTSAQLSDVYDTAAMTESLNTEAIQPYGSRPSFCTLIHPNLVEYTELRDLGFRRCCCNCYLRLRENLTDCKPTV
jgi:hypothetical protein